MKNIIHGTLLLTFLLVLACGERKVSMQGFPGLWTLIDADSLTGDRLRGLSQRIDLDEQWTFSEGVLKEFFDAQDTIWISNDTFYLNDLIHWVLLAPYRQTLSFSNPNLGISGGNSVDLSALAGSGSGGAAVMIPDYDSLRNYGGSATVVIISDSRTNGVFYYDETAGENGGTEIGGNWRRLFDGNTFIPEWWEIGGYNSSGIAGGVVNDCDALRSCTQVADSGATISLRKNKVYEIDAEITLKPKQFIRGNGATIKRKTTPVATLTGSESIGSTTWEISDTTGFRVGQKVTITDVSATNSGKGFDENDGVANIHVINAVNANSLSITGGLARSFVSGDKVIVITNMFVMTSGADYDNLIFEHLNIDGNRTGNDETYDWRFNWSATLGTGKNVTFRACNFYNTPAENITFGSGIVDGCDFRNMNGSGLHISSDGTYVGVKVFNCTFLNVNEIGNDIMNHSEAAFTFSANSVGAQVNNCRFENGGEAVIGIAGSDDYELQLTDCFARNFNSIFTQSSSTVTVKVSNYKFTDNTFDNCGDIIINGNSVTKGLTVNKVDFVGNTFVNGRMYCRNISQGSFEQNNWFYDTTGFTAWTTATSGQDAYIQFLDFDQITFRNNQVIGPLVNNPRVKNGVLFQHNNVRSKDDTGTNTNYLYAQNIKIIGNTVANFTQGITTQASSSRAATSTYQAVGWEIANNQVYVTRNVINGNETMGILAESGVYAHDNVIYMPDTLTTSNSIALICLGPFSDTSALMGAIVKDNIVYGPTATVQSIRIGNTNNTCNKNIICTGNISSRVVTGITTKSYLADNLVMASSLLSALTAPAVPLVHDWQEYKNLY